MKKLNNKGMTIVELLIGFVIVMIIFISLFSVVSTYRDRLQTEGYRNQLVTFQTTLYKAIYDDIKNVSNPLTGVTSGTNCSDDGNTLSFLELTIDEYSSFTLLFIGLSNAKKALITSLSLYSISYISTVYSLTLPSSSVSSTFLP